MAAALFILRGDVPRARSLNDTWVAETTDSSSLHCGPGSTRPQPDGELLRDETVVRIANSVTGTTDSIVTPSGDRMGVKAGGTVNWFLPDLHGDIAGSLTQDEATVSHAIRYDAYGQTIATGSAGGATPVGERAWKYQGRLDISPDGLGTPLYDMSARFYNPGIGAFTQLDTVMGGAQDPRSMNRFLYAHANPATLTDPTGHCAVGAQARSGDVPRWQGPRD